MKNKERKYSRTKNGREYLFDKIKKRTFPIKQNSRRTIPDLFSERPKLLLEIPLKYIASYIGVTPQALNRIRKRIN